MIHNNSAYVSSLKLLEQPCKLRPTIIAVDQKDFRPHYVELHRCQGTCENSLHPSQMPCVAVSVQHVTLALTALTREIRDKVVRLVNHTGCGCGSTAQGQGSDNEKGLCA